MAFCITHCLSELYPRCFHVQILNSQQKRNECKLQPPWLIKFERKHQVLLPLCRCPNPKVLTKSCEVSIKDWSLALFHPHVFSGIQAQRYYYKQLDSGLCSSEEFLLRATRTHNRCHCLTVKQWLFRAVIEAEKTYLQNVTFQLEKIYTVTELLFFLQGDCALGLPFDIWKAAGRHVLLVPTYFFISW